MAYIGKAPASGIRSRFIYTATAGQTTFSGADDESRTLSYTDGHFTDVYLNGVKLDKSDYTATSGTSVVLDEGAAVDDILEVIVFDTFSVFNGEFSQDVTVGADLTVNTDTLYVDSTNNKISSGTTSAVDRLHLHSTAAETNGIRLSNSATGATSSDGFQIYAGSTGQAVLRQRENDAMVMMTNNTERMRIDSSGNVGIGMTPSGDTLHEVYGANGATVYKNTTSGTGLSDGFYVGLGKTNSTIGYLYNRENNHIIIGTNNTERVRIEGSTGYFKAQGVYDGTTGGGSAVRVLSNGYVFRFTSSQRYKNTITDATHGLTELLTLRPVTYKHNSDGDTIYGGLIAEEVHTAGLTEFIEYDEDGNPDALRYDSMVSLCIKAIQELKAELDAEKTKVATLQTQATDFETRIAALEAN